MTARTGGESGGDAVPSPPLASAASLPPPPARADTWLPRRADTAVDSTKGTCRRGGGDGEGGGPGVLALGAGVGGMAGVFAGSATAAPDAAPPPVRAACGRPHEAQVGVLLAGDSEESGAGGAGAGGGAAAASDESSISAKAE